MHDPRQNPSDAERRAVAPQASALSLVPVKSDDNLAMPDGMQSLPEMAWCASADGTRFVGNARWHAVTGMADVRFALADWLEAMHADDRSHLAGDWANSVETGTALETVVRHRCAGGGFAWMQVRMQPVRDEIGAICHWFGVGADIDRLKTSEASAVLIANELAHRIGNIFAVVGGMLSLSAREQPEAAQFAKSTAARIAALATAHAFIWPPMLGGDAAPQQVSTLIGLLLLPYGTPDGPEISVSGDDAVVVGTAATCVTLIIHELATNAAKHGALSCRDGRLTVRLRRSPTHLTIIWSEHGGPAIVQPPTRTGFGTGLIDRVTRLGQVARARRWWRRDGLLMVLRLTL